VTSSPTGPVTSSAANVRRGVIACLVVGGHALLGVMLRWNDVRVAASAGSSTPIYAEWIEEIPPDEPLFVPNVEVPELQVPPPELPDVSVTHVVDAPNLESPRIDPNWGPDAREFTRRAALPAGKKATIMLMVAIGIDGTVISARVVRSNGTEIANAVAIEYARETRWIPGMVDGKPSPMETSLTVVFGDSA